MRGHAQRAAALVLAALVVVMAATGGAAATGARDTAPRFSRTALAPKVNPSHALLADLDGDGREDLITAVGRSERNMEFTIGVSVMLRRAGGGMDPAVRFPLDGLASQLQAVDVNADGKLDVVATTAVDGEDGPLMVLPGNGDGSLGEGHWLGGQFAGSVAFGRFSSEVVEGVAVGTNGSVRLQRLGGYVFKAEKVSLPATRVYAVDFDADGRDELVAFNPGTLSVYRGFAPHAETNVSGEFSDVSAADVTGDGRPELIVASSAGVHVYDRDLQVLEHFKTPAVTATAGDLDGDGQAEIAVAGPLSNVEIFAGSDRRRSVLALARPAEDLAVGDVEGDARGELLAVEPQSSVIEVVGDYATGLSPSPRFAQTFSRGWNTVLVDLNNDGRQDMLAANCWTYIGDGVSFRIDSYLSDGKGGFKRAQSIDVVGSVCGIAAGDVNGDRKADLVIAEYYTGGLRQWFGNGDGTFGPGIFVQACHFAMDSGIADFNGDGYQDAAVLCRAVNTPAMVSILTGSAAGLVRTPVPLAYQFNAESYLLQFGDLNGDDNVDVVVGSFNDSCVPGFCYSDDPTRARPVTYFLGNGDLTFELARSFRPGAPFFDLEVVDTDGDGKDEIVAPLVFEDVVRIFAGHADGVSTTPRELRTYDYPDAVTSGDITGDGVPDIVFGHGPNMISVMAGTGGGEFDAPHGYVAQNPLGDVFTGDFNGDARLDVLAVEAGQAEIFLQR